MPSDHQKDRKAQKRAAAQRKHGGRGKGGKTGTSASFDKSTATEKKLDPGTDKNDKELTSLENSAASSPACSQETTSTECPVKCKNESSEKASSPDTTSTEYPVKGKNESSDKASISSGSPVTTSVEYSEKDKSKCSKKEEKSREGSQQSEFHLTSSPTGSPDTTSTAYPVNGKKDKVEQKSLYGEQKGGFKVASSSRVEHMEQTPVYTKEKENGAKLASLLIDEGSPVLRYLLLKQLPQGLATELGKVKDVMWNYVKGESIDSKGIITKVAKQLNKYQFDLLYPKYGCRPDTNKFDLSLLFFLFREICKLPQQGNPYPDQTDSSLPADIIRLRRIRNSLYGHLTETAVPQIQFEKRWRELSEILIRLGGNKSKIKTLKERPFSLHEAEKHAEELKRIFHNDLADVQTIREVLIDKMKKNKDELKELLEDQYELLLLNLGKSSSEVSALEQTFQEVLSKMKQLPECKTFLGNLLKGHIESVSLVAETVKKEVAAEVASVVSSTIKMALSSEEESTVSLNDLKEILTDHKESFKIVILNSPGTLTDEEVIKALANSLGNTLFDVVIDLDTDSEKPSSLSSLTLKNLDEWKDMKIIATQSGVELITFLDDKDVQNIALTTQESKSLWVRASGNVELVRHQITGLLHEIFRSFEENTPILCVFLVLSEVEFKPKAFRKMNKAVNQAFEMSESRNAEVIQYALYSNASLRESVDLKSITYHICPIWEMATLFAKEDIGNRYLSYPGRNGDKYLFLREYKSYRSVAELYHKDIGNLYFEGKTEKEKNELMQHHRREYLKGNEITPEVMHLHDVSSKKSYVIRDRVEKLQTKIRQRLSKSPYFGSGSAYRLNFKIYHEPSAGGTTAGRTILWVLHNDYPCVVVKETSEKFFDLVEILTKESELPVVLLMDGFDKNEVEAVLRTLCGKSKKKFILIQVERVVPNEPLASPKDSIFEIFLTMEVNKNSLEYSNFNNLYISTVEEDAESPNKVILFGLYAFLGEHKKIKDHISTCITHPTTKQEQIIVLRIACYLWKLTSQSLAIDIVTMLLCCQTQQKSTTRNKLLKEELGLIWDIMVLNKTGTGLRPAHSCIIDTVLEKATGTDNPAEQLSLFVEDILTKVVTEQNSSVNAIPHLVQELFIHRQIDESFSNLVIDMRNLWKDDDNPRKVLDKLSELSRMLQDTKQGQHVKAMYARFLMFEAKKILPQEHENFTESAITVMQSALNLKSSDSIAHSPETDTALLNTYGTLLKEKAKRFYISKLVQVKDFQNVVNCVEEAITAFRKAQRTSENKVSVSPYMGEVTARLVLLERYSKEMCDGKPQNFTPVMASLSDKKLVQESEREAHRKLECIELIIKQNRNKLETYRSLEYTQDQILEFRKRLFTLWNKELKVTKCRPEVPCVVSSVVLAKTSWKHAKQQQLQDIMKASFARVTLRKDDSGSDTPNALSSNYSDYLNASIYQAFNFPCQSTTSLDTACAAARDWAHFYSDDHEAHFILGVIKLVMAVYETEDKLRNSLSAEAKESLKKCFTIGKRYSTLYFTKKQFFVREAKGIRAIMPYSDEQGKGTLFLFSGKQCSNREIRVDQFNGRIKALMTTEQKADDETGKREWEFNLALSHDSIQVVNAREKR